MQFVHRCLQLRTDNCAIARLAWFGIRATWQVLALDLARAAHWAFNSSHSSSGSSGTSWHQKPRTVEALGSPESLNTG